MTKKNARNETKSFKRLNEKKRKNLPHQTPTKSTSDLYNVKQIIKISL